MARLLLDGGALERLAFLLERQPRKLLARHGHPGLLGRLRAGFLRARAALDDGGPGGAGTLRMLRLPGAGALIHELVDIRRVIHAARFHHGHGLLARDDLAALPELAPHAVRFLGEGFVLRHLLPGLYEVDRIGHALEPLQERARADLQKAGENRDVRLHELLGPLSTPTRGKPLRLLAREAHERHWPLLLRGRLRREEPQGPLKGGAVLALGGEVALELREAGLGGIGCRRLGRDLGRREAFGGGGSGLFVSHRHGTGRSSAGSFHQSRRNSGASWRAASAMARASARRASADKARDLTNSGTTRRWSSSTWPRRFMATYGSVTSSTKRDAIRPSTYWRR